MTQGNSDLLLFSCSGKSIRFVETDVRVMGRSARGVKGIALKSDQRLISMLVVDENELDKTVLTQPLVAMENVLRSRHSHVSVGAGKV